VKGYTIELVYSLGVHPKNPIHALLGDMGWVSAQARRHCNMLHYWNRLVNINDNRLTKKLFEHHYSLCKDNWCCEIKTLLLSVELGHIYNNMNTCDVVSCRNSRAMIYEEKWKFGLTTKPKLRTYITFKNTFTTEEYVQYCNSRTKRSFLAQFRSGTLPLAIETGRFKNLKPEDRVCELCNCGDTESEFHFLSICIAY
jgi:hypothetical protein